MLSIFAAAVMVATTLAVGFAWRALDTMSDELRTARLREAELLAAQVEYFVSAAFFDLELTAAVVATDLEARRAPGFGNDSLPFDDVEAMRQMLLDLLADNPDLAEMDERLVAMVARIVEAYGKYSSSRGPSFSSYQALKAMTLDELEGKLLAGLLAPYGDEPTPTQEQIAKALAAQRISQLRKMVDAGRLGRKAKKGFFSYE